MVEELQMPQRGPRGVRDVPAEQFIRAYAEHLKANDKVGLLCLHSKPGEFRSVSTANATPYSAA
jgi:hypothetical protein